MMLAQCFGGVAYLTLARQKHQHITSSCLGKQFIHRVHYRLFDIDRVFAQERVLDIVTVLEAAQDEWSRETAALLRSLTAMQQRLRSHGDSVDDLLLLADWAVERGEPSEE